MSESKKKRKRPRPPIVIGRMLPVWRCRSCRASHIERGAPTEFSQEEIIEHGITPENRGDWRTIPDVVECRKCGAEFRLRILGYEGIEGDDDNEFGIPSDDPDKVF